MNQVDNSKQNKTYVRANGVQVRPLYIRNMSLEDWNLISKLKNHFNQKNEANTIRFIIRKLAEGI